MARWRWRGADRAAPPALSSTGALITVLDRAPAVLLITDEAGEIVYRNQAAAAMVADTVREYGEQALQVLRDELREIVRRVGTVPATQSVPTFVNGRRLHGSSTVDRVPGGYIVTWVDMTRQVESAEVINALAGELTRASTELAQAGRELADAAGHSARRAQTVSQGSAEMAASIQEIGARVTAATSSTGRAVASAQDTARGVAQLRESSEQIGSITKLITEIAEQTKLLALNAQIESARAGEAGRGFAVVAGEVKELAGRSADATQQIITMIEGVQTESAQAVDGISGIVGLIEEVAAQQSRIATEVEEQTATSSEMSTGMQAVAESVQAAARAAETVLAAAATLREQATRLSQVTA